MALATLQFVASAAVILFAGIRLSRYGDVIAVKTGLGGTWMGVLVMAAVTSLPELVTGLSAVLVFDLVDIAAGDAIGSCLFNLAVLAFLDFRDPAPLSARIHQGHVLTAGFGIVLLGLAALASLAGAAAPAIGWIGVHSLVFVAVYVLAMRTVVTFERIRVAGIAEEITGEIRYQEIPLRRAVLLYAGYALLLVGAAIYLPGAAGQLAAVTGLDQSFVGSLFVAISTSMPEVVVSAAAVRLGAFDMAVGNLFGSNLFNIAVLGLDDIVYTSGPMLAVVSPAHAVSLIAAMTMTGIAVVGVTYRAQRKRFPLSWDALAIVAVYVAAILMIGG